MINTYNETHLHKTLKEIYSMELENSKQEVQINNYIADINNEKSIIEVQTKNIGQLFKKAIFFLNEGYSFKIVYPLVISKNIETYKDGNLISKRKSPDKKTIYSVFKELTKMKKLLLKENFSIDVVTVEITEERIKLEEEVQSKNKQRRYKRDWLKQGKRLEQIFETYTFSNKDDYINLIPFDKNEEFSVKDVLLKLNETSKPKVKESDIRYFIWVLKEMELIKNSSKKGNTKLYKII